MDSLATQLGPPPFRFETQMAHGLSAPAFSVFFRGLSFALVLFLSVWLARLWHTGIFAQAQSSGLGWLICAIALLWYTQWHILRSRTTLHNGVITQTWVWDKQVELRELAYVKIFRLPYLDWLIAPRLYARSLLGKFTFIYCASPHMLREWQRLQAELQAFRRGQLSL